MITSTPLLQLKGVFKSFPGVKALRGVDLTLSQGEVLALVGENGAGKSTLMKILGGAQLPDVGTIEIEGKQLSFPRPLDSRHAGVAIIYQEFNLVPGLTAIENIFLGNEKASSGWINHQLERKLACELFKRLGVNIPLDVPCRLLTTAQHQLIEIAKAISQDAKILVMDEPSAALSNNEVHKLHNIIYELRKQGIGIIYITHRLEEVFAIADRVTVLRDGKNVGERSIHQITRNEMIEMMVGREFKDEFPPRQVKIGETRLNVQSLNRHRYVQDVSFKVRRGEILGLTGLVGAGRTEVVRLIFGADRKVAGIIELDGKILSINSPSDAIAAGIGLLTEDRKLQGLILKHSVRDNYGLPNLNRLSNWGFVRHQTELREFNSYTAQLGIKISHPEQHAGLLSGGNQQKVVLAKWLARKCEVLIFDEPTRGIDVGAKYEIYKLINELADAGKAIILISSELPEIIGMADRILVMNDGKIAGELLDVSNITQQQIMELAVN